MDVTKVWKAIGRLDEINGDYYNNIGDHIKDSIKADLLQKGLGQPIRDWLRADGHAEWKLYSCQTKEHSVEAQR